MITGIILCEFNGSSEAALFTGDALFTINNREKPYCVQSYSELQAAAQNKAREIAQQTEPLDTNQGVVLELTNETNTISGLRARRLKKMSDSQTPGLKCRRATKGFNKEVGRFMVISTCSQKGALTC